MKIIRKIIKLRIIDNINDLYGTFDVEVPSLSNLSLSDFFKMIQNEGLLLRCDEKYEEIFKDCCSKCPHYNGCKYLEFVKSDPYVFYINGYVDCNTSKSLYECGIRDNDEIGLWSNNLHCDHYFRGWRVYKKYENNISKITVKILNESIFDLFLELDQYSVNSLLEDLIRKNILDNHDIIRHTNKQKLDNPMYYLKAPNNVCYHINTNVSLKTIGIVDNDVIEIGISEAGALTIPDIKKFHIMINNKVTVTLDNINTYGTTPDDLVQVLISSGIIPTGHRIEDGVKKNYSFLNKSKNVKYLLPQKESLSLNKYGYFDGDTFQLVEDEYKAEDGYNYLRIVLLNNECEYLPVDVEIATPRSIIDYFIDINKLLAEYVINGETIKINYAYLDKNGREIPVSGDYSLKQLGFQYFDEFVIRTL